MCAIAAPPEYGLKGFFGGEALVNVLGVLRSVRVHVMGLLRCVEHQSVPLALDVIVLRLLSDVEAVKLQLPGQLFLSLEDD